MRRVVLLVVALLAVACGGAGIPSAQSQQDLSTAVEAAGAAAPEPQSGTVAKSAKPKRVPDDTEVAETGVASDAAGAAGTARDAVAKGTGKGRAPVATETPLVTQPRDAVEASAIVVPECVRPGGTITITVTTRPNAGVGYHAFYADGKGGGPPPYGNSYGGNDGGLADEAGQYSDTWTVAPTAPVGPGRVDVIVGHNNEFGNTKATFAVADAVTGTCAP